MEFFYWLIFLAALGMSILVVQNSNAPLVIINFLAWRFEASLIHTILGSVGVGILATLFLWVPRAIKSSIRFRALKRRMGSGGAFVQGSTKPTQLENESRASMEFTGDMKRISGYISARGSSHVS